MVSDVGCRFPLEWENGGASSYILFLTSECWLNTCVQFVKIRSAGHLVYGHFSVCMLSSMKKHFFKPELMELALSRCILITSISWLYLTYEDTQLFLLRQSNRWRKNLGIILSFF